MKKKNLMNSLTALVLSGNSSDSSFSYGYPPKK